MQDVGYGLFAYAIVLCIMLGESSENRPSNTSVGVQVFAILDLELLRAFEIAEMALS